METACSKWSENDLVLVACVQLLVRQNHGVEDDHFTGDRHIRSCTIKINFTVTAPPAALSLQTVKHVQGGPAKVRPTYIFDGNIRMRR